MKYYTVPPSKKLAHLVRFFWVLEGEGPYVHRSMADGCCELLFHYHGVFDELIGDDTTERSFVSGISGPSSVFRRFAIKQNFGMVGAYFYPFAIPMLFNISATSLANNMPDVQTIFGQEGKDLEENVMLAEDNTQRIGYITSFLEKKITSVPYTLPKVFSCIRHVIDTHGMDSVDTLADNNFLSKRQLERTFKEHAGFSPKLYSRIIRFQAAMMEYNSKKSLTEIAYHCGYYDQSHFIHDFKEFSGHHPRKYFLGRAEGTEWRGNQ